MIFEVSTYILIYGYIIPYFFPYQIEFIIINYIIPFLNNIYYYKKQNRVIEVKIFTEKKKMVEDQNYFGMLNIGINPTTDNDKNLKIEVNIFDFEKDIYNKSIKLNFIKRLRDEQKFNNLNELIEQLNKDKENCLALIKTKT